MDLGHGGPGRLLGRPPQHLAGPAPHLRLLEQGRTDRIMEIVKAGFDAYVGFTVHHAIFSREGFTAELERRARKERVLLVEGVPV